MTTTTLNSTKEVALERTFQWKPIDANTPRGVNMLVINRAMGVASIGRISKDSELFYTHWCGLPTFPK